MKQHRNLRTLLAAGAAVASLCVANSALAQGLTQGKGVVRSIKGTATYSTPGGSTLPLKVGATLPPGSTIQAGSESSVDVFLDINGPTLRVTANTIVALDSLSYTGSGDDAVIETKLNLEDGRILGEVRKLSAASKYEVKTPTGVAGIRGTKYDIRARKNNGKPEVIYICVTGSIVGADSQNGTAQSFTLGDKNGFGPGGPFTLTDSEIALINDLFNQGTFFGAVGGFGGFAGGGEQPILIHLAPANPGKVDLSGTSSTTTTTTTTTVTGQN
jgi:hypothetical protein